MTSSPQHMDMKQLVDSHSLVTGERGLCCSAKLIELGIGKIQDVKRAFFPGNIPY